ncbi:MAG: valine--tRNA ligase [Alphaproteobacteria bacterium]|nr:valine--tRNA ligase [Alphaproteobacteria bacterium]
MIEKTYIPADVEGSIYENWEKSGAFACHPDCDKEPYCIMIPPPNVTGNLHIGHALTFTIQDSLIRYHRMKGQDVLWQPGTDHAGIATQMVVERLLAKEGITRHDLGREKFLEKVWEWKAQSGGQITKQLRRLGASLDWPRERFTMDEGLCKAVRQEFVTLYKEGLVYRAKRLVNWDPYLQTAVSDLEVEQRETVGTMWYFKYAVEGEKDRYITIATTRPETLFGDTAVAVSDQDERYKDIIGKNVIIPICNRAIPVVADEHADPTKGTGAVKITPAHDFNDYEVGKRHNLPMINILDSQAHLNENTPKEYQGMSTQDARKKVLEDVKALGLFVKEEPNPMTIPYGDRSGVVIEPWLTDQWFVDAPKLAVEAIKVVEEGKMEFVPKSWEKTYFEWMRNIQPWCVSRQLWWGHQIPVWYGPDGHFFVEENVELAQKEADKYYGKHVDLVQDPDVFDTWFSSGIWPFSTLGWPDNTKELARYYPTNVLVTAFDIIFFWVARMVMLGLHFMHEVPFKTVYIHALVRDEQGRKMSKSKGNVVDPLILADKYGVDALRFTLSAMAAQGRDVCMSESRVEGYRNFVTKIWNAARFGEMNECVSLKDFDPKSVKEPLNKWIISKAANAMKKTTVAFDEYKFNEAAEAGYQFAWGTYCDWYLEFAKSLLFGEDEAKKAETRATAAWVLDQILIMLHPIMPFVTEKLWNRFDRDEMLMLTKWPNLDSLINEDDEAEIDWCVSLISSIRSLRTELNIVPSSKIPMLLHSNDALDCERFNKYNQFVKSLARLEKAELSKDSNDAKGAAQLVFGKSVVLLPLAGVIDVDKELDRLGKDRAKLEKEIEGLNSRLSNEAFISKAPAKVIEDQKRKVVEYQASLAKMIEAENRLKAL